MSNMQRLEKVVDDISVQGALVLLALLCEGRGDSATADLPTAKKWWDAAVRIAKLSKQIEA